MPENASGLRIQ